jgi:hypothetical protein
VLDRDAGLEVIRIRVAASNGEDARPQDVANPVRDPGGIAMIGDQRRQTIDQAQPLVGSCQQAHAAIGADRATIESRGDFLATDRWQREGTLRIVIHGGCGYSCPTSELVSAPHLYVRSESYAAPASESLPCSE